jgi:hypothetical protein
MNKTSSIPALAIPATSKTNVIYWDASRKVRHSGVINTPQPPTLDRLRVVLLTEKKIGLSQVEELRAVAPRGY